MVLGFKIESGQILLDHLLVAHSEFVEIRFALSVKAPMPSSDFSEPQTCERNSMPARHDA